MTNPKPGNERRDHVIIGMAAALGSFFMYTVMNTFAKLLSDNHSVVEIAFYRNLVACLPFLVMVFVFGKREILKIHSKPAVVGIRAVAAFGRVPQCSSCDCDGFQLQQYRLGNPVRLVDME